MEFYFISISSSSSSAPSIDQIICRQNEAKILSSDVTSIISNRSSRYLESQIKNEEFLIKKRKSQLKIYDEKNCFDQSELDYDHSKRCWMLLMMNDDNNDVGDGVVVVVNNDDDVCLMNDFRIFFNVPKNQNEFSNHSSEFQF